jgi:hypothetical protein
MQNEINWTDEFNTPLTPEEETEFQSWAGKTSKSLGRNILRDIEDYDLRGQWKNEYASTDDVPEKGKHGPDSFKKPNHPTFSNESVYSGKKTKYGVFVGGSWKDNEFHVSREMLDRGTHDEKRLTDYFNRYESETALVMPDGRYIPTKTAAEKFYPQRENKTTHVEK